MTLHCVQAPSLLAQVPDIAFAHVTVIDVAEGRLLLDRTVTIRGDRILAVTASATAKVPAGTRMIDATGKFMIPGLWDMHAHVFAFTRADLKQFVLNGVTGMRDLGGQSDSVFAIAREISTGQLVGPRIVAAGFMIDRGGERNPPHLAPVHTAAEGRAAVRANAAAGARVIKVWSMIPRDAFLGVADEARRAGLPLVGHLPTSMELASAVEAGQRGFEHTMTLPIALSRDGPAILQRLRARVAGAGQGGIFAALIAADVEAIASFDEAIAVKAFELLARDSVWVCPTLTDSRAYTIMKDSLATDPRFQHFSPALRDAWLADVNGMSETDIAGLKQLFPNSLMLAGRLHRAGVGLLAGTDAGSTYDFPGFDLHNELALMVRAGLTPLEALRTATINPARAMKMEKEVGQVAAGMHADLVLLNANPLEDIRNTTRIAKVVAAGKVIE